MQAHNSFQFHDKDVKYVTQKSMYSHIFPLVVTTKKRLHLPLFYVANVRNGDRLHELVAFAQHCLNVTEFINVLVVIHFQKTEMFLIFIFNKSLQMEKFVLIFINTRWKSKGAKTVLYKVSLEPQCQTTKQWCYTATSRCHTATPRFHTTVLHCSATLFYTVTSQCHTKVPHYLTAPMTHRCI